MTVRIVTADGVRADRWVGLVHSMGGDCEEIRSLAGLEKAGGSGEAFVALVDWELVSKDPALRIRRLSDAAPRVRILLFGDEKVFYGPRSADAIGAGAHGFLVLSAGDEALSKRLSLHLEELAGREPLKAKGLRVDVARREVRARVRGAWRKVEGLTPKEFDILCLFLEAPGVDLPRGLLADKVWGKKARAVNLEAVDKKVASLRRKLGPQGRHIRTRRGVGYRFIENA